MSKNETFILERYIKALDKAAGRNPHKIEELLEDEDSFKKYLISIGMNPEWMENISIMEIVKSRLLSILSTKGSTKFSKEGILYGGNKLFKVTENGFQISENEFFRYSEIPGKIEYIRHNGLRTFEKRIINELGIVEYEVHRFGKNAIDEMSNNCNQIVEYTRLPNKPYILYHLISKPFKNEKEQETKYRQYDYGYPSTLEKNGSVRNKTPIYFLKRYPNYKKWFETRFKDKDEFVLKVFEVQESQMEKIWTRYKERLDSKVDYYSKLRLKLDLVYNTLLESFEKGFAGSIFKGILFHRIKRIIEEDKLNIFYDSEQQEALKKYMLDRLGGEVVDEIRADDIAEDVKDILKNRIVDNFEIKKAKETIYTKKSITDDDYSLEDAFMDIKKKNAVVRSFSPNNDNPFIEEQENLEERINFLENQIKVLKESCYPIPKIGKKFGNTYFEKEKKESQQEFNEVDDDIR